MPNALAIPIVQRKADYGAGFFGQY